MNRGIYSAPFDELAFTTHRPNLPATGNLQLLDKNPDLLRLMIGKRGEKGLKESWLSSATADKAALKVWKKIAKRLIGMTKQGALAVNPAIGASGPARRHRYTLGAKMLEATGAQMLDIGGAITFKLGLGPDETAP